MPITPEYAMPTLQCSLLCEDVRQEMHGQNTLVGVLNVIPAVQVPVNILKFCIWTRWCNGVGKFRQISRLLGPDEERVVNDTSIDFELRDSETHTTNVNVYAGIQFKEFGAHHVEIHLNDSLMLRYPLGVVRVNR